MKNPFASHAKKSKLVIKLQSDKSKQIQAVNAYRVFNSDDTIEGNAQKSSGNEVVNQDQMILAIASANVASGRKSEKSPIHAASVNTVSENNTIDSKTQSANNEFHGKSADSKFHN